MHRRSIIVGCATIFIASVPTLAHDVAKGPHGGRVVEAGSYHLELVAANDAIDVFLTDASDKPVVPAGFKGIAILVIGGKSTRIVLEPSTDNRLTGSAPSARTDVKGVVQ